MGPKKGETVKLKGLVAKPELNGCTGVVTKPYDSKRGRCRIRLHDGTIVNAKMSNIVTSDDPAAAAPTPTPTPAAQSAHGLTEEQLDYIFTEALLSENDGGEHSIEECAWQLGVHPFHIGGGSIRVARDTNKREFIKGDVAKIWMDKTGVEWDGSPRFGMGPYKQQKTPVDWIAKARQGKSQREKDLEKFLEDKL
mmetsp:Transcript_4264/g.4852  ORF Transcript_4264/g.4852 Transcript_4264/m.4852 type:complete len:195 (+) Transcript_4264:75-659(+)|eukprot:CAMPEP_0171009510 /NCGR_PEP_ID=MMETSP0736-20130129/21351_1 /TAXON_ID=186038 /ORGANISM="Fragilariopsis kerguelensis, Strain L26-C5" /LENGTH=194 /DNA_ID=CAMNT_0011441111 /DNA_START=57 /DNA_END=641 /DNA_ORIENTATION=-